MSRVFDFARSAVGKKVIMAVTGLILFGFVFGHMVGNLKLFYGIDAEGRYALDVYAEGLRELGKPILGHGQALWIARIVLLAAVGLHIWAATTLTLQNRRARPVDYVGRKAIQAGYAERTMRYGGVIILLFVLYHLAHLTLGTAHHDFQAGAVHHNVVSGFKVWWVSAFYIVANLALAFHLYHGLWSLFQSLGWSHPRWNPLRRQFAVVFAVVVCAANISFPVAVLTGFVG
jgi:succinate dehydrogenase / fumarate reductase cytochrome b subunit